MTAVVCMYVTLYIITSFKNSIVLIRISTFLSMQLTYSLAGRSMSSLRGSKNFTTVSQDEIFEGSEMRS